MAEILPIRRKHYPINQSIEQSINQSINQSTNQSIIKTPLKKLLDLVKKIREASTTLEGNRQRSSRMGNTKGTLEEVVLKSLPSRPNDEIQRLETFAEGTFKVCWGTGLDI